MPSQLGGGGLQAGRLCEQGGDGSVGVDLRQGEICGAQGDPVFAGVADAVPFVVEVGVDHLLSMREQIGDHVHSGGAGVVVRRSSNVANLRSVTMASTLTPGDTSMLTSWLKSV